jgi:hypothetical protein
MPKIENDPIPTASLDPISLAIDLFDAMIGDIEIELEDSEETSVLRELLELKSDKLTQRQDFLIIDQNDIDEDIALDKDIEQEFKRIKEQVVKDNKELEFQLTDMIKELLTSLTEKERLTALDKLATALLDHLSHNKKEKPKKLERITQRIMKKSLKDLHGHLKKIYNFAIRSKGNDADEKKLEKTNLLVKKLLKDAKKEMIDHIVSLAKNNYKIQASKSTSHMLSHFPQSDLVAYGNTQLEAGSSENDEDAAVVIEDSKNSVFFHPPAKKKPIDKKKAPKNSSDHKKNKTKTPVLTINTNNASKDKEN